MTVKKEDKIYVVNHKIGRKIPETVSKFSENDEEILEITSPEIFRVIIKWVNDMSDYLLNPS